MKNISPYITSVSLNNRTEIKNHEACILWFTGLSGSGKSTIANRVEERLNNEFETHTYLLDGDNIRTGLNSDRIPSSTIRIFSSDEYFRRVFRLLFLTVDSTVVLLFSVMHISLIYYPLFD